MSDLYCTTCGHFVPHAEAESLEVKDGSGCYSCGMGPLRVSEEPLIDRLRAKAHADYAAVSGKLVKCCRVEGYMNDDQRTIALDPPAEFIVLAGQNVSNLLRQVDEWLDPFYDLAATPETAARLAGYDNFWCYGTSYNLKTGEVEVGDIVPAGAAG